jgi:hypothetical protein
MITVKIIWFSFNASLAQSVQNKARNEGGITYLSSSDTTKLKDESLVPFYSVSFHSKSNST